MLLFVDVCSAIDVTMYHLLLYSFLTCLITFVWTLGKDEVAQSDPYKNWNRLGFCGLAQAGMILL